MNTVYLKNIVNHSALYIECLVKSPQLPYILFVHGGPGLNSGTLSYLIEKEGLFDQLNCNLILYDQRGCGRSKPSDRLVLHQDNISDLDSILRMFKEQLSLRVIAIAGHSYGAKLVFDYITMYQIKIPCIFIGIAASMLTPRINNLMIDFAYLKSVDREAYQKVLSKFTSVSPEILWDITEDLAGIFQSNKTRPYFYWANLDCKEKIEKIQALIDLPMCIEVFKSVRMDLYSHLDKLSVDIQGTIDSPYLWINGFHDFIMSGSSSLIDKHRAISLFFKSSHYPHIEESDRFCEEINAFIENI